MTQLMPPPVRPQHLYLLSCLVRESLPWILAQFGKSRKLFIGIGPFGHINGTTSGHLKQFSFLKKWILLTGWGPSSVGVLAELVSGWYPETVCLPSNQISSVLPLSLEPQRLRHPRSFTPGIRIHIRFCDNDFAYLFTDNCWCFWYSCLQRWGGSIWLYFLQGTLLLGFYFQDLVLKISFFTWNSFIRELVSTTSSTEDVMVTEYSSEEWKLACLVSVWVLLSSPEKKDWEGTFSYGLMTWGS